VLDLTTAQINRAVTTITTQNTMFFTAEFTRFLLPGEQPAARMSPPALP
jgi:hypothetical protein